MTKDPFYDKVTLLHHEEGTTSFVDKHEKNAQQFFAIDPAEVTDTLNIVHTAGNVIVGIAKYSDTPVRLSDKPLVFTDTVWTSAAHIQSLSRILREPPKRVKPKIARKGRYYIKADMTVIPIAAIPHSYRFNTKRAAIKFWSKQVRIVSSQKQFLATFGIPDFKLDTSDARIRKFGIDSLSFYNGLRRVDVMGTSTGRINAETLVTSQVPREGKFTIEILKERSSPTKREFKTHFDFENMRIEDPDTDGSK